MRLRLAPTRPRAAPHSPGAAEHTGSSRPKDACELVDCSAQSERLCEACARQLALLASNDRAASSPRVRVLTVSHPPTSGASGNASRCGLGILLPATPEPVPPPSYDVAARAPGAAGWLLYRKRFEPQPRLVLIDCHGRIGLACGPAPRHPKLDRAGPSPGPSVGPGIVKRLPARLRSAGADEPTHEPHGVPRPAPARYEDPFVEELRARAVAVLADVIDSAPRVLTADAVLVDDLGADSLQMVEVALAFEDVFGVDLAQERIEQVRTVGDALDCLEAAVRRRGRRSARSADRGTRTRLFWPLTI